MHPWFDPRKARLWTRSEARVYGTFERLFDTRTHGWANVQASHVNLPLGRDHEAAAMMTAAAMLIPYLPAVAASTPIHDGRLQPEADSRLAWILTHQDRVPESAGTIVPEYCDGLPQYRRDVLGRLYDAVDRLPDSGAIRHEFLNCRGAVFKFSRASMEVRVLDMQECVKMDVAIAAFVRSALKALTRRVLEGEIVRPDHRLLVEDFRATIRAGSRARVRAPHLWTGGLVPVREILGRLLDLARETVRSDEAHYLDLVAAVVERGTLAERIAAALKPHAHDPHRFTDAARRLYVDLTECLRSNQVWE
jgi:glutamate--cysteine ligase